ncbi:MAG: hypothetical protein JXC32_19410 [Anaerolineae bacterium]|nr:hypothetical protein [Anaerolineae bacterium]
MRRNWFWGLVLLLVGAVLLLDNLGYLNFLGVSVWRIIWPLALIGLGIWFLVGVRSASTETRELTVEHEGTEEAELHMDYGAGEIRVEASQGAAELLTGTFEGGVTERVERSGGRARIWLSSPAVSIIWPWFWTQGTHRRWHVRLSPDVPLALSVKTGASDCRLNLRELQVRHLRIDSGASSLEVTLPARAGMTEVRGSSGAASVVLRVPEGVAARIRTSGGLSSTSVDRRRFPRQGGAYQSPDYETAENRVDIQLQIGVGSIEVR